MIPFAKPSGAFNKGLFGAIQNEVFFNIQNKDKVINNFFDQNRVYMAVGYSFSPKMDVDAGYMNQLVKGATTDVSNNIVQLALYTRL